MCVGICIWICGPWGEQRTSAVRQLKRGRPRQPLVSQFILFSSFFQRHLKPPEPMEVPNVVFARLPYESILCSRIAPLRCRDPDTPEVVALCDPSSIHGEDQIVCW
jgi:hypothetical protein